MPYDCSKTTGVTFSAKPGVLQSYGELYTAEIESSDEEVQSPEEQGEGAYRRNNFYWDQC